MRLLMTCPSSPIAALDSQLSQIKFLLPLSQDVTHLHRCLGAIDTICHLGCLAHEIVAVDDASADGTAAEARRYAHFMPLWLIQHRQPMGRAVAFRTSVEAACRDIGENDLLVPVDPTRRLDAQTVLRGITAAYAGWDAVLAPGPGAVRSDGTERTFQNVTVYRAGLVREHLTGFLETLPAEDSAALCQLDRYLRSVGVPFHRLSARRLDMLTRGLPMEPISPLRSLVGRTH
jgi:glycosyltransferase involved in cell wall biosynthesis